MDNAAVKKIMVGIVMGGISSEREVSLESGRNVFSKISRQRFDVIPIFMDSQALFWEIPLKLLMRNSTRDIEEDLLDEARHIPYDTLPSRVDVVFIALHGKYGEDGCCQGLFELLNVPYTGSGVLASALGMDKLASRKVLAADNIAVPLCLPILQSQWEQGDRDAQVQTVAREIGFPCIVKPSREGCSTAVAKVASAIEFPAALTAALRWDNTALVEEFITGTEVTCGVIGHQSPLPLVPSETIPTTDVLSLEDKFLYGQGENKTPARLPEQTIANIQDTAVKTFRSLDLKGYARIDMFVRANGEIVVLEPNTLPGMTPSTVLFHQAAAAGITQSELIERIIDYALEVHGNKRGPL